MQVIVSIDDTDNLESKATGQLAQQIAKTVEAESWGKIHGVTRHQLLIHPDIPYTSHNSAMCFAAELGAEYLAELIAYASGFLESESAEGSDPGLCVVSLDTLKSAGDLISFGRKAKEIVISIEEAYAVAKRLDVHLSEHGGTGQGVIGALAGAGLRLSGNDGRLQGSLKVKAENGLLSVREICAQTLIKSVQSFDGTRLAEDCLVCIEGIVKPVVIEGKFVLLVLPADQNTDGNQANWRTCGKRELEGF